MKTCATCIHWVGATAECCVMLKALADNESIPVCIENAFELDTTAENDCDYYEEA